MKKIIIGLIIGLVCGLLSSGGGLIAVPFFLYILKMDEKEARASTVVSIFPMVIASLIVYKNNLNCVNDYKIGIICGLGGMVGGIIGSKLLKKIPDKLLQILFIIFLIYSGIKLLK